MITTNPDALNEALSDWLDIALLEVPTSVSDAVRAELHAHYADALRELQASGKSVTQAHQTALAQLGDADDTARAFREVYAGEYNPQHAVMVSFVYPIAFLLVFALPPPYGNLVAFPALTAAMIYLLVNFHRLLAKQYGFRGLRYPALVTTLGFIAFSGIACLAPLVRGADWLIYVFSIAPTGKMSQITAAGYLGGLALAAVGMVWLAARLGVGFPRQLPTRTRLVGYAFVALLALSGVGLGALAMLTMRQSWGFADAALMTVALTLCGVHLLWGLLFIHLVRYAPQKRSI